VAHHAIGAGEELDVAEGVTVRAIATPGHTPDHLAYLMSAGGVPVGLFSGGSLMVGALGRTDLLGDEHREALARDLFRALHAEILTLPDDLPVDPTHGAGSFCSAPSGSSRTTTIGTERATNHLLGIEDEDEFVRTLVSELGSFPRYFRELPEINRRGPRLYPALPHLARLDLAAVQAHLAAGAALVDARPIADFARAHAAGSISIQHRPVFASWLGWLLDLDRPVVFILDEDTDRDDLVRQALTIGHDAILGELDGGLHTWIAAGHPTASIDLVDADGVRGTILDIRQSNEWAAGCSASVSSRSPAMVADARCPDEELPEAAFIGCSTCIAADLAAPCFAPFSHREGGDDECGDRVGPPPAEGRVGEQADEQDRGQVAAQQRLAAVGNHGSARHAVSEAPLRDREYRHDNQGERSEDDARHRFLWFGSSDEVPGGLTCDVGGEHEEAPGNELQRPLLAFDIRSGELPHDDHRGADLDDGVQPEPHERDRAGLRTRRDGHDRFDAVPCDGRPRQGQRAASPTGPI
jgi:rhodanese-related sulfurtransferase